jgi:ribosomal protein S18 acetylase RimI-like enzyme
MAIEQREHGRDDVAELIGALAAWEAPGGHAPVLHVGDVGWHLRGDDDALMGTIRSWWRDGRLVAAALVEGPTARPRIAPGCLHDVEVCRALAEAIDETPHDEAWSDAQPGSLLRTLLVGRGWTLDPDVWTALHRDLRAYEPSGEVCVTPTGDDVEARVDVQFHGFDNSTFTTQAWHRMAAGPGFDPSLDLVAWDHDGVPVAGATAWSAGPGRCGILEPVATHREHRRAGHGRRVVLAAFDALASAGASGVSVCTPGTNAAALALYTNAGMRPVETIQALTRRR